MFYGDTLALGNGSVNTWVERSADHAPEKIGVTIAEQALDGLPSNFLEMPIDLPRVLSDSLFTHVLFDWNPEGHPPPAIYNLPHFDIHFYIVPQSDRTAVVQGPDLVLPQPRFVPTDYVPDSNPPMAIPNMGAHWVDSTSAEWNGEKFTETFIYGYYQGEMYFVEPMITLEYLEASPSFVEDIKQPEAYQKRGYYPTKYSIIHDEANQVYRVFIHDFVFQSSSTAVAANTDKAPEGFSLEQNYPNPFNPSTTIQYSIPQQDYVTVEIFNMAGQKIKTLVNEFQPAGKHKVV